MFGSKLLFYHSTNYQIKYIRDNTRTENEINEPKYDLYSESLLVIYGFIVAAKISPSFKIDILLLISKQIKNKIKLYYLNKVFTLNIG